MPVFRVTLMQVWRGQSIQNVLHMSSSGAAMTQVQVADAVQTGWINQVRIQQVNELSYVTVKVQELGANIGPPFLKQINVLGSQGASSSLHLFTCLVLKATAFAPGRKAYGRCFIGGHVLGAFVNGLLEIGVSNAWNNTILPALRNSFTGLTPSSGLNWGLITKGQSNTFRSIEQIQIRTTTGSQRRRNLGNGI